ncbi:TetR/AcrR family transcriptional regulator [Streptomyces sp. GQFP]|uniref:TetR/AcrR family transcriptional regulator n=1 Tax=Streptomyces sp. GQFP TaxID=2907545 RepID=UPI001F491F13|nr:TetR/AcrR family transcriptional regulator [Streptomyces sp. GQFP]UIX31976.1 TetR/AcrR family transcriptional regulator [Streptomyces sp. GQFP]
MTGPSRDTAPIPADDDAPVSKRPVGRPRREIDLERVADVAARLYAEKGYDAVSIESVAEELGVSRATLYRTVRTMDDLHTLLFERSTRNVEVGARRLLREHKDSREALIALIAYQVDASIRMRQYVGVYFGWGLPAETYERWRHWAAGYESLWAKTVARAVEDGHLHAQDPLVATRLILGMVNWVSRWYRSSGTDTADSIALEVIRLVLHDGPVPEQIQNVDQYLKSIQ